MKRPFLWIVLSLITSVLMWQHKEVFACAAFLAFCFCFYKYKNTGINVFLILPVVFIFGFMLRNATNYDLPFSNTLDAYIECRVESTEFTDNNKQRLEVTVNHIKYEDTEKNCDYSAFLYTPENTYVKSGDIIYSKGVISSSVPTVKGKYNFENYLKCENMDFVFFAENIYLKNHDKLKITDYIDSIRNSLVSNFYSILPEREASVVSAVVMGYDSLLTDETRDVYSAGGIAHMLAVSGLHVSVMYGFIIYVLSKVLSTKRAYIVSIFFVAFYAVFTGMSSSVVRASIMTEIMLLGMVLEKRSDGLNSLCAAVTLMVIFNPYVIYNAGFLMSVISTYAVMAVVFSNGESITEKIVSIIKKSFMVTAFTLPVISYFFYNVSFAGIFVNIVAIPLMTPLLVLAIIGGIVTFVSAPLGIFVSGGIYVILKLIDVLCNYFSGTFLANINTGNLGLIFICLYYILIMLLVKGNLHSRKVIVSSVAVFMSMMFVLTSNRFLFKENYIDFIDVGQGECTIVRTYDGGTYVFDTGGFYTEKENTENTGLGTIIPYLNYYGINSITALFISHPDMDHSYGALELIENIDIGNIFVADFDYGDNAIYNEIIASAQYKNIPVSKIKAGDSALLSGGINIDCLYPLKTPVFNEIDTNKGSLVLKLTCGSVSVLFTGDVDIDVENLLMIANSNMYCDILKVAHHGSKYSTSAEFVKYIDPEYAVISSGKNNIYGHPSDEVIENLILNGTKIYNTAVNGTVTVKTDGRDYEIYTAIEEET